MPTLLESLGELEEAMAPIFLRQARATLIKEDAIIMRRELTAEEKEFIKAADEWANSISEELENANTD